MSPSAGPFVRGNRSDRDSHAVSHNFSSKVFKQNLYGKCFGQSIIQ